MDKLREAINNRKPGELSKQKVVESISIEDVELFAKKVADFKIKIKDANLDSKEFVEKINNFEKTLAVYTAFYQIETIVKNTLNATDNVTNNSTGVIASHTDDGTKTINQNNGVTAAKQTSKTMLKNNCAMPNNSSKVCFIPLERKSVSEVFSMCHIGYPDTLKELLQKNQLENCIKMSIFKQTAKGTRIHLGANHIVYNFFI